MLTKHHKVSLVIFYVFSIGTILCIFCWSISKAPLIGQNLFENSIASGSFMDTLYIGNPRLITVWIMTLHWSYDRSPPKNHLCPFFFSNIVMAASLPLGMVTWTHFIHLAASSLSQPFAVSCSHMTAICDIFCLFLAFPVSHKNHPLEKKKWFT